MKIFDFNQQIPKYLTTHKKAHNVLAVTLSLIVAPILSAIMIAGGNANMVTTSISKLGWQSNMLPVVYIWGLYNIAIFSYLLKLSLDNGQYSKASKIFFYVLTALSCAILFVGISVPFISDDLPQHVLMRKIHNVFATLGFVMFVVVLISLTVTTFFRNNMQALISTGLLAFFIISGVFSVLCVNSPEKATFITAASQMYIFSMIHVLLVFQYFFNSLLPNERKEQAETSEQ